MRTQPPPAEETLLSLHILRVRKPFPEITQQTLSYITGPN